MAKKGKFDAILQGAVKQREDSEEQIKKQITINEELKGFIPPLSDDEYHQLEKNILEEGCRDALIVWKNNGTYVLVDGHNRYGICTKNKLDFKIELKDFANLEDVKDWMINNQLGKRNVTEEAKSYLRGQQYKREKRQGTRSDLTSGQNVQKSDTRQKLAEQHNVSAKTIQRDEKFSEGIDKLSGDDKTLKWKILNKEISLPKGWVMELADKDEKEIKAYRENLKKGKDFKELEKPVEKEVKKKTTNAKPLDKTGAEIEKTKSAILKAFKEFSQKKDRNTLSKIKSLLDDLEKSIFE